MQGLWGGRDCESQPVPCLMLSVCVQMVVVGHHRCCHMFRLKFAANITLTVLNLASLLFHNLCSP